MSTKIFDLTFTPDKYILYKKSNLNKNQRVTAWNLQIYNRLYNTLSDIMDENFVWENVVFAGGLVNGILDSKFDEEKYKKSDIDLFVYGKKDEVPSIMQRIYTYFRNKHESMYSFVYKHVTLLTILIPGKRSIQIIGTGYDTALNVISDFDLTHCQVGFDGKEIITTSGFDEAIKTRESMVTKKAVHAYRLAKAYIRGFSVIKNPNLDVIYLMNYNHSYTSGGYDYDYVKKEDIKTIDDINVDDLLSNATVQKNLDKNYVPNVDEDYDTALKNISKSYESSPGKNIHILSKDVKDINQYLVFKRVMF
jgi:hypothetical protein